MSKNIIITGGFLVLCMALSFIALSTAAHAMPSYYYTSQNGSQLSGTAPVMLSAFWNSSSQLSIAVLSTNETGTWVNYSKPVEYSEEFITNIFYENVQDGVLPTDTNVSLFESEMKYLYDNGYRSITFRELASYCSNGTKVPEKTVLISFDSVLNCTYTNAFRILKKYGLTATFFVRTDVLNQPGQLNNSMILEMHKAGFEIGDHSKTHKSLTDSNVNYTSEINDSRDYIASIIGASPVSFAYPYASANSTVYALLKQSGFTNARTTFRGDYAGVGEQYRRTALEPFTMDCTSNNMYYIHTSSPTGMNNSYSVTNLSARYANYTGRNEIEDMYVVIKDDNLNLGTTDRYNDSFSDVVLPDKNDAISVNFSVANSAGYNLTFRVRTGTVADNPLILAHLLNYIIDGNVYVGNSTRAPVINSSRHYFVNDTGNYVWGFHRISNVYLKAGLHNITIQHNNNGTTGIGLDYFLVDYNDTAINSSNYYKSPMHIRGYSGWSNYTWQNSSMPSNSVVGWRIYSNDSSNEWGATPIQTFVSNYTYTPAVNCSCTEYDPLWSGNYTAYNKIWSSTYNQTYDAALNRNITDEVVKAINESGIAACNGLISWDLNKAWTNTLGGGNITEGTISSSLLSSVFGISSGNITSWNSNIETAGAYNSSGYVIKPYSGASQPFDCAPDSEGWMFYNTSSHTLMLCNGAVWRNVLLE